MSHSAPTVLRSFTGVALMPSLLPPAEVGRLTALLVARGISPPGARQLLLGENVTDARDRAAAVQLIHAEKNQDIQVEYDETHRVGHDRAVGRMVVPGRTETVDQNETITVVGNRTEILRRVGFSPAGVFQLSTGLPVSDANDRRLLAVVVARRLVLYSPGTGPIAFPDVC